MVQPKLRVASRSKTSLTLDKELNARSVSQIQWSEISYMSDVPGMNCFFDLITGAWLKSLVQGIHYRDYNNLDKCVLYGNIWKCQTSPEISSHFSFNLSPLCVFYTAGLPRLSLHFSFHWMSAQHSNEELRLFVTTHRDLIQAIKQFLHLEPTCL